MLTNRLRLWTDEYPEEYDPGGSALLDDRFLFLEGRGGIYKYEGRSNIVGTF